MIEIFFIFIQLLIFISFFSLNYLIFNQNFLEKINFDIFENFTFNVIIQSNFILILSFFNLSLNNIIYLCIFFNIIILIFYLIRRKTIKIKISKIDLTAFFFSFVCLAIFFDVSFNLVLGWDVEKFWVYKTLNFYNGRSIEN